MSANELYHYGVLGMKWGTRRSQAKLSSAGRKSKSKTSEKKDIKSMSDDELRKRVNRLQMEKQYSQLSSENTKSGRDYVKSIIKAGTTVAAVTTTGLTIYNNAGKIKEILDKTIKK